MRPADQRRQFPGLSTMKSGLHVFAGAKRCRRIFARQSCAGLNGGPEFKHNEAFSFQVTTEDQAETERLWDAIVGNGGQAGACGWCKDTWGLSWQITPRVLMAAITDPERAAAKRAFDAMMQMGKIDIARIEAARRG
jgi:predicted 3-demethylubiquinone-9 3-methyltransferase (glyoxalase superfamily)